MTVLFLNVFWTLALLAFLYFYKGWKRTGIESKWLTAGLAIKILAGLFFLYVYSVQYGNKSLSADAGEFMRESKILFEVFWKSPRDYFRFLFGFDDHVLEMKYLYGIHHWSAGEGTVMNDSQNVLRVNSILHFISGGSAYVHMLFLSFFSLVGLVQLTQAFHRFINLNRNYLFIALLLAPSTLFWTSSILKEPMLFVGVGFLLRGVLDLSLTNRKRLIWMLIGFVFLLGFKPYVLLFILISLLAAAVTHFLGSRWGYSLVLGSVVLSFVCAYTPIGDKLLYTISRKQYDFDNVGRGGIHTVTDSCFYVVSFKDSTKFTRQDGFLTLKKPVSVTKLARFGMEDRESVELYTNEPLVIFATSAECGSFIETKPINNRWDRLGWSAPTALFNALIRPLPNDPGSWLIYPAFLETLLLFGWLLFSFVKRKSQTGKSRLVIGGLLLFIVGMSLLIGWTTPVLGAIVRYRFTVYLALMIIGFIWLYPRAQDKQG